MSPPPVPANTHTQTHTPQRVVDKLAKVEKALGVTFQ